MVISATTLRTARDLLALVTQFEPAVEGEELGFTAEVPADLERALRVLHTGVRAVLTGRAGWGASTGNKPRVVELSADAPIPSGIGLLCVAGDSRWDRIGPSARLDLPHLFATPARQVLPGAVETPAPAGNGRASRQSVLRTLSEG